MIFQLLYYQMHDFSLLLSSYLNRRLKGLVKLSQYLLIEGSKIGVIVIGEVVAGEDVSSTVIE